MDWNALWAKLISSLDFTAVANGLLGVVLLLLSALGIRRGKQLRAEEKPEVTKTSIFTTDSVAMDRLAGSVEALNMSVIETNALIKREIEQREFDEKVEEEVQRRLKNQRDK